VNLLDCVFPRGNAHDIRLFQHARLLRDQRRLLPYLAAAADLFSPGDEVVDIGAGTGILLKRLLDHMPIKRAVAIECDIRALRLAQHALRGYPVTFFASEARQVTLSPRSSRAVISELMGPIGCDEGIVETLYDFVRRHPDVNRVLPHRLNVQAVCIYSEEISAMQTELSDAYASLCLEQKEGGLRYSLGAAFSRILWTAYISNFTIHGHARPLAEFNLGRTPSSAFAKTLTDFPRTHWNALVIFFNAIFAPGVFLDSFPHSQLSNWLCNFIIRPKGGQTVQLVHRLGRNPLNIQWY
jgi:hypothetical protein